MSVCRWQRHRRQARSELAHPSGRGLEERRQRINRAPGCVLVSLRFDAWADELEVERAVVPSGHHVAEEALERYVAVTGDDAIGRVVRADDEVADLHELDDVDAVAQCCGEAPLGPARV